MAQTLYRKYRSQRFSELVGQTSVTRVLRNSITRGRLNHAYLFAGPRGTGKTSVARIFAKALNCLDPQDGDACGVCDACVAIANGTAVDVIEIDAASNRGIEDVRDLRERVNYAPLSFKYKVYIIDEAHMITGPAFNALLKTLEEPPGFVIFCLCTTEAHKLPVTILSRCIRFDFQRLPLPALAAHLQYIAREEGLQLDQDAALSLAEIAEGSARDAISLLDQLTAYCNGDITLPDVRELFHLADTSFALRVLDLIVQGDPDGLLAAWREMLEQGVDAARFLFAIAGEVKKRYLETRLEAYRRTLEVLWQGVNMLKLESFPSLLVELTLLEAQAVWREPAPIPAGVPAPPHKETRTAANMQPTADRAPQSIEAVRTPPAVHAVAAQVIPPGSIGSAPRQSETTTVQSPQGPEVPEEPAWARFLDEVRRRQITTYTHVFKCAKALAMKGVLHLGYRQNQRLSYEAVQKPEHVKVLLAAAAAAYGPATAVAVMIDGLDGSEVRIGSSDSQNVNAIREETPPEIDSDVIEDVENSSVLPRAADPGALLSEEEALYADLRAADRPGTEQLLPPAKRQPVTAQEAMNLFEGVELDDEEFEK